MPKAERVSLDAKTRFKLTQLVLTKFPTANMDDADFAKKAEEELGCNVTRAHVAHIRRTFEIPPYKAEVRGGSRLATLEKRVDELEQHLEKRVEELERLLEILMQERAEKHGRTPH